jgi:hypothetical protein
MLTMRRRDALELWGVEPIGDQRTRWILGGRATRDIPVGDVLLFDVPPERGGEQRVAFTVERIRTYGHDLPELSRGLTGQFTVRGGGAELLKRGDLLATGSDPAWPAHIESALRALSPVPRLLDPASPEAEQYVDRFIERWGDLELDGLLRAEAGTRGAEDNDRLFVLYALGHTGAPAAQSRLIPLLQSGGAGDRWASALLLGRLGERRALPVLCSMLTEGLPERIDVFLNTPRSYYDRVRWDLPVVIERLADPLAVPPLRAALERLVHVLDQTTLPESDQEALARAHLDSTAMTLEQIGRVRAVFEPKVRTLLARVGARDPVRDADPSAHTGTKTTKRSQFSAQIGRLFEFEDDIVFALGRLGAMGALTGLSAAPPFLDVWMVHLAMAEVYDRFAQGDVARSLSPDLESALRQRLMATFGLAAHEQDHALALYALTTRAAAWNRYLRGKTER